MTGLIIALLIATNVCFLIELKFKDRYKKALVEISKMGAVCDDFEFCDHISCKHSCGAALVAMNALKNT